jgi:hypothetical protein
VEVAINPNVARDHVDGDEGDKQVCPSCRVADGLVFVLYVLLWPTLGLESRRSVASRLDLRVHDGRASIGCSAHGVGGEMTDMRWGSV